MEYACTCECVAGRGVEDCLLYFAVLPVKMTLRHETSEKGSDLCRCLEEKRSRDGTANPKALIGVG